VKLVHPIVPLNRNLNNPSKKNQGLIV